MDLGAARYEIFREKVSRGGGDRTTSEHTHLLLPMQCQAAFWQELLQKGHVLPQPSACIKVNI
jgi:hypothetical protein